jgi:hypothetical protein
VVVPAPLELVREAFRAAGEKRFLLARALYRTLLGRHWGHVVLAFAYMKRLDDLVDEDPEPDHALAVLREHRRFVASIYAGEPADDGLTVPARFAEPFLVWDRDNGAPLRPGLERIMQTMEFDTRRRGRSIDARALDAYVLELGAGVIETIVRLLGPSIELPREFVMAASRAYLGADALMDARHDLALGLVNIPGEDSRRHGLTPDAADPGLAAWILERGPRVLAEFDQALAWGRRLDRWSVRLLARLYLTTKRRRLCRFLAQEATSRTDQAAAA